MPNAAQRILTKFCGLGAYRPNVYCPNQLSASLLTSALDPPLILISTDLHKALIHGVLKKECFIIVLVSKSSCVHVVWIICLWIPQVESKKNICFHSPSLQSMCDRCPKSPPLLSSGIIIRRIYDQGILKKKQGNITTKSFSFTTK